MLTDLDLANVQAACRTMCKRVTILAHSAGTDGPFETNLFNIARQVSGVSQDMIRLEETAEPIYPGKCSLTLSDGQNRNIHYLAMPEGRELSPFLDAISWLGGAGMNLGAGVGKTLEQLSEPAHLQVLMTEACPHCPNAVAAALMLAVARPSITVSVVDVLWFEDMAQRYKVKSTPTIVVNEGLTLVGRVTVQDLALQIVEASASLTSVLKSMMDAGRAEDAAAVLCRAEQPEALLPFYISEEFSTRMAALVVMEEALERNPRILDPIVGRLIELLFGDDVALRGDTAELLGKIGSPEAIPALQKAAQDEDPDVREAAEEALETLSS